MGIENCHKISMLITDQVATAPCTDCVQARGPTFEAKPPDTKKMLKLVALAPLTTIGGI